MIYEENRTVRKTLPLDGMRKVITSTMTESIVKFPQGTAFRKVNMEPLIEYREALKAKDVKVSFGDLFVKAIGCAIAENMNFNASRVDEELIYYDNINIGMMATINGYLMKPVVCDVNKKDIEEISKELKEAYENLKAGKLMRVNMVGSCFSISNLGMYDVEGFTPLLPPRESGILGIGKTEKYPIVEEDDTIKVQKMTTLSITTDHGLIDGVEVMEFMKSLSNILQNPKDYMYLK